MHTPEEKLPIEALLAHEGFVMALARRLVGNEADAEDLAQEVWTSSLRGALPRTENLRGWLAAVARKRWSSRRRAEAARRARERRGARPEAIDSEPAAQGLELRRRVLDAVRSLPEPYLTTIYLRYYEELPVAQVAERMQVPFETTRSRLARGVELLRERLDRDFGSRESWALALLPLCRLERGLPPPAPAATRLAWLLGAGALVATALWVARPWTSTPPGGAATAGTRLASAARSETPPDDVAGRTAGREPALAAESPGGGEAGAGAVAPVDERAEEGAPAAPPGDHRDLRYALELRVLKPNGLPAPGALIGYLGEWLEADEEGRSRLEIVVTRYAGPEDSRRRRLPMVAFAAGHRPARIEDIGARLSDDPSALQPIELVLGGPPRSLSGRVRLSDGAPAAGWRVNLRDPSPGMQRDLREHVYLETMAAGREPTAEVDAEGRFALDGLFDRAYDLIAWDPRTLAHVVLEDVPATETSVELAAPAPSAGRRVAGRAVSRVGAPLRGLELVPALTVRRSAERLFRNETAFGPGAVTDEQGLFALPQRYLDAVWLAGRSDTLLIFDYDFGPVGEMQDSERLELVPHLRCEVVLEARAGPPPADMLVFLDEAGARLYVRVSDEEAEAMGGMFLWRALMLDPETTRRVVHATDDAVAAAFVDFDGTEIERRPLQLSPDRPTTIAW